MKSRKKQKRDNEDYKDDQAEDEELESEGSWRAFVTAQMMKTDVALGSLAEENTELREEVREMRKESTEDQREYFWEVGRIRKDVRVMESWVQQILKWVEEKNSEEELEEELGLESGNREIEEKEKEDEGEMESEEKSVEVKEETEVEKKVEEEKTEEEKGDGDVEME